MEIEAIGFFGKDESVIFKAKVLSLTPYKVAPTKVIKIGYHYQLKCFLNNFNLYKLSTVDKNTQETDTASNHLEQLIKDSTKQNAEFLKVLVGFGEMFKNKTLDSLVY